MTNPVFVDMDNTLNAFSEGFANTTNKILGTNIQISGKDLVSYHIEEAPQFHGLPDIKTRVFHDPSFWINIPVLEGAVEGLQFIYENYDTYVLTAPFFAYKDCMKDKMDWMERHFPFFNVKKMIFCNDKHLITRGTLVDDHEDNLSKWEGTTVRVEYPYNMGCQVDHSCKDWKEIKKLFGG